MEETLATGSTAVTNEAPAAPVTQGTQLSWETLAQLPPTVEAPAYDPRQVTAGILHVGAGNFFMSHLASFIHDLLPLDSRWGIKATSINSGNTVRALASQDGLFLLVVRKNGTRSVRVLAPIVSTMFGGDDPDQFAADMADENIKLVTVTISNAGYCLNEGNLDMKHADVLHDLAMPEKPRSVYGYLARGLAARKKTGKPLTLMSLDNVQQNSKALKTGLIQFLQEIDQELADWVLENVFFPVTLVDRITPKSTDELRNEIKQETGVHSSVVVPTESFRQLVVERPTDARFELPDWEKVGVQMVDDCSRYWQRKFFALNAGHCVVAMPAQRLGVQFIHDAMAHTSIARLLERAHQEWLTILPGDRQELQRYMAEIRERFADPALGDEVPRVAARGTEKVTLRLLASVEAALKVQPDVLKVPTFVSAVWLFNLGREDEFGEHIALHDAEAEKLHELHLEVMKWVRSLGQEQDPGDINLEHVRAFLRTIAETLGEPRFARLSKNDDFVRELTWAIVTIHRHGIEQAIQLLLVR